MNSNITEVLKSDLVQSLLLAVGEKADLHIAGGAVRDLLLNKSPKDLDFATVLSPKEISTLIEPTDIKIVNKGIRRGTLTVLIGDQTVEITTFRNPENESEFTSSIEEDLPARDFSINAMAISINSGKLIDPFGGQSDLELGFLKAVRDPDKRFKEDPHRILRMVRFGPAQGRTIEWCTLQAALSNVALLKNVSIERITEEFLKILCSEFASKAFRFMLEHGILEVILPELAACAGVTQNKYHIHDVFEHTLTVLEHTPQDKVTRLAALFHDIGKPHSITFNEETQQRQFKGHEDISAKMTEQIMSRMKMSTQDTKNVCLLVQEHMRPIQCGPKAVRRTIVKLGDLFNKWLDLKHADYVHGGRAIDPASLVSDWNLFIKEVEEEKLRKQEQKYDSLAINGDDLLKLGYKEGKFLGDTLSLLRDLVLDDPSLNQRELLLSRAENILKGLDNV